MPQFSARLGKRYLLKRKTNGSQSQHQQNQQREPEFDAASHATTNNNSIGNNANIMINTKNSTIQVKCVGCGTVFECFKSSIALDCPNCHEFHPTVICRIVQNRIVK